MYSIKVESSDDKKSPIQRDLCSNNEIELLPVIVQICKQEYKFSHPIISPQGNSRYYVYDRDNPLLHGFITIRQG